MDYSAKEIGEILETLFQDLLTEVNKNGQPAKSTVVMMESYINELKNIK